MKKFKIEAVQLTRQSGEPVNIVASNLGLNASMLRRWCKGVEETDY